MSSSSHVGFVLDDADKTTRADKHLGRGEYQTESRSMNRRVAAIQERLGLFHPVVGPARFSKTPPSSGTEPRQARLETKCQLLGLIRNDNELTQCSGGPTID